MKFLIVLLAIVALIWLLAGSLRRRMPPMATRGRERGAPQPMLVCAQCGIHLPRDEALPGRGGVFCGSAHRAAYENAHPAP